MEYQELDTERKLHMVRQGILQLEGQAFEAEMNATIFPEQAAQLKRTATEKLRARDELRAKYADLFAAEE